jgi:hypothetical protein
MTRASYYEILLASLDGDHPRFLGMVSPEEAYQLLQQRTGQDFGFEIKAWEKWLDENEEDWRFETRPQPQMSFLKSCKKSLAHWFGLLVSTSKGGDPNGEDICG